MKRIAILISNKGTGSNLAAIIKAIAEKKIKNGKIVVVVSNKTDAYGLVRAKKAKIPTEVLNLKEYIQKGKTRLQYDNELGRLLKVKYKADLIVLAGWMLILSDEFIKYFPHRIINLHPGLLPDGNRKYLILSNGEKIEAIRGLHTNDAVAYAIEHKFPVTGSTVHFITPKVDEGDVIIRSEVNINQNDTVESLYERMKKEEHKILPIAINQLCQKTTKILIIGAGGREHAVGWKLKQSEKNIKLFFAPGNGGTAQIGTNINIGTEDINNLLEFAKKENIDLTIVGPEGSLSLGIVNLFNKHNLKIFGPSQKAALLETSKVWSAKFMKRHNIPSAEFFVFNDVNKAIEFIKSKNWNSWVIKADGLALGKGVVVPGSQREAIETIRQMMVAKKYGKAGETIVLQKKLEGEEVSLIGFCDGKTILPLLPVQDHKRINDGDKGPNTGGMGAYAPVPFVNKKLMAEIYQKVFLPVMLGMKKEGIFYKGILYAGLMLTDSGPKVLEFNVRFGDPETQPQLVLLKDDLLSIINDCILGKLKKPISFHKGNAVCVVLAAKGYPGKYQKSNKISGLESIHEDVRIFHSGTINNKGDIFTNGGRVLGITSTGYNLKTAIQKAYSVIGKKKIYFAGMHFRKDIGGKAL